MCMVPENEWLLDDGNLELDRRAWLQNPPSPKELLELLVTDAQQAAVEDRVGLRWKPASDKKGFLRIEAKIPIFKKEVLDWLFNGRSGYRAQYYLASKKGDRYNREIVEALMTVITLAFEKGSYGISVSWDLLVLPYMAGVARFGSKEIGRYTVSQVFCEFKGGLTIGRKKKKNPSQWD